MKNQFDYSEYECPFSHVEKECGHELVGPEGYENTHGVWCACGFRGPVLCLNPEALNLPLKPMTKTEEKAARFYCIKQKGSEHWFNVFKFNTGDEKKDVFMGEVVKPLADMINASAPDKVVISRECALFAQKAIEGIYITEPEFKGLDHRGSKLWKELKQAIKEQNSG